MTLLRTDLPRWCKPLRLLLLGVFGIDLLYWLWMVVVENEPNAHQLWAASIASVDLLLVVGLWAMSFKPSWWRGLGILASFALSSAICAEAVPAMLMAISQGSWYPDPVPRSVWPAVTAGSVAILVCARRPHAAALVATAIAFATFFTIEGLALYTRWELARLESEWRAKGMSVTMADVVREPDTRRECGPWLRRADDPPRAACASGGQPIRGVYRRTEQALISGGEVRAAVAAGEADSSSCAPAFAAWDDAVSTAMGRCSRLQWTPRATEPRGLPRRALAPGDLGLITWSRAAFARALVSAARHEPGEPWRSCARLGEAAAKLGGSRPELIDSHIAVHIEGNEAECLIAAEALCGRDCAEPGLDVARERQEPDFTGLARAWELERVYAMDEARGVPDREMLVSKRLRERVWKPPSDFVLTGPLPRIAALWVWLPDLRRQTEWWEHGVPAAMREHRTIPWPELKSRFGGPLTSNFMSDIEHRLATAGRWRLALAVARVLDYRHDHGDLPADVTAFGSAWPRDPFDDQPLRYRREADGTFTVWSVGPNLVDQGGRKLSLNSIEVMQGERDFGVRICPPQE